MGVDHEGVDHLLLFGIGLNFWTTDAYRPSQDPNDYTLFEYDITLIAYDATLYVNWGSYAVIKCEIGADFNLWDSVTIPLSEFVAVGAPPTAIVQIDSGTPAAPYLDSPHFDVLVPRHAFVDEYNEKKQDDLRLTV